MKNKAITIFLISIAIIIVVVVTFDFSSTKRGKGPENPYEFNVEEFKSVDPSLVKYRETKQIRVNAEMPHGIVCHGDTIYLIADSFLQSFEISGKQLLRVTFEKEPYCLDVMENENIAIGFRNSIAILNSTGKILKNSIVENYKAIYTSLAVNGNSIYVADAGNRKVVIFNENAEKTAEFSGESGVTDKYGFIIPSPYFDLDFNNTGELWIVNPGLHALQNYSDNGKLRGYWENSSITIEGFSGCCNPAHFTFLPDGDFVTSEKGLVRIKVYNPAGELKAVVAPPQKFAEDGHAPDLTADKKGNIYALDFNKKLIRVFTPTQE